MRDKAPARIVDLTLRDGEQAAGVTFPRERRIELAYALLEAGVRELEAGVPAMGEDAADDFRRLSRELSEVKVIAWNRVRKDDVEASARAEARVVHVAVPASDLMLGAKLGWSRERALDELAGVLEYCRLLGIEAMVGAEDASRADPRFLERIFSTAAEGGAVRLRYADTLGAQEPFGVRETIGDLVARSPLPVEYHGHNDLGLAAANAIAALDAGAMVSVTACGLGERAGNASLEQVACAYALLRRDDLGISLGRLAPLAELVSELSGRPIPADKPLVGSAAFAHESGIHVDAILKSPETYEFVRPEALGKRRVFVPGSHSGEAALRHCARALGYDLTRPELDLLHARVKEAWSRGAPRDPWTAFSEILSREFAG
jgi:homocitrate synthase NifV